MRDYGKVLILGQSGYGKSYLFRDCADDKFGLINTERKPLPFKGILKYHSKPTSWSGFIKVLEEYIKNPDIERIGIDSQSMAFDILYNECQTNFKGYDIYSTFNRLVVRFFDLMRDAEKDMIVTGHDEILLIEGFKQKRAKIQGKMFEGRVEAYYTTVLYADKGLNAGKPWYKLKTVMADTSSKAPPDMFGKEKTELDNSGAFIYEKIKEYYT